MTNKISQQFLTIKECSLLITATGERAKNIMELIKELKYVEPESLNYHFWGTKLSPRFEEPEYYNDFAVWASSALHDNRLAERLSMINPGKLNLEEVRSSIIDILSQTENTRNEAPDQQFHFKSSKTVIFNTKYSVSTAEEFAELLPKLSFESVYYHFIEAPCYAGNNEDDFISWLSGFRESLSTLANKVSGLNPYFYSLSELRSKLSTTINEQLEGNG